MDKLKAMMLANKKAKEELFQGRTVVKNSELEEAKLKKLREEEAQESQEKVRNSRSSRFLVTGWLSIFLISYLFFYQYAQDAKRRKVDAGDASGSGTPMEVRCLFILVDFVSVS